MSDQKKNFGKRSTEEVSLASMESTFNSDKIKKTGLTDDKSLSNSKKNLMKLHVTNNNFPLNKNTLR
ncbi:hypothetical protein LCGC14_2737490 [marine sediment metagenome]|uniref:Uncharacterized protein n=1 Tax=marine sediment metagenome TaxID=412755 RepID=A0A0F8ZSP2_9ZZZZ